MLDFQTMIVYLSSLALSLLLIYCGQKKGSFLYLLLAVGVLTLVGGLKASSVGNDSPSYYYNFTLIGNGNIKNSWFETGFVYLVFAIYSIFKNPQWCFVVLHFIMYFLFVLRLWDFRKTISLPIAFYALYTIFFFFSLTGIRQALAVSFVFYASRFIQKKNYLVFIIITIIASFVHRSALIGLILLFVELFEWKHLNKWQKSFLVIGIILSPVLIVYSINYLSRYEYYLGQTIIVDIGLTLPLKIAFLVLTLFLFRKPQEKSSQLVCSNGGTAYLVSTTRFYYFIGILLTFTGYFVSNISRIGWYFYIFEAIYFGFLFNSKKYRHFLQFCVLIVITVLFILSFGNNGEGVFPYRFFWQQAY